MWATGFGSVLLGWRFDNVLTACPSCGVMLDFWMLPSFPDEVRNA
jgi:hypothetical protein